MKLFSSIGAVLLLVLAIPGVTFAQAPKRASALTYEVAEQAAEATEAEARRNGWNFTIVVADSAGIPVYDKRMTGASPFTYEIAFRKAPTFAASGLSTLEYAQQVAAGRGEAIPDAITFEAGLPIRIGAR